MTTLTTPAPPPSQQAAPAAAASPQAASSPAHPDQVSPQAPAQLGSSQTAPAASQTAAAGAPTLPPNLVSAPAAPAIPEKFKVVKADGSIDHEATLAKALGSYTYLEKRLGSGDVPPETEAGYKLDYAAFPEGITINPEGEKALLKKLHGSGMTNKQVQTVINEYGSVIKQGLELQKTQEGDRVAATLKDVATELSATWGANFEANQQAAIRGFNHLADATDKADLSKIGVDAKATYKILMKVLAKVGAGITEDRQISGVEMATIDSDLEALQKSEAYIKSDHPDHKATVAKVTALYEKKYPKKQ